MAALAGDDLGDHRALRHRLVRQHRLADQIADRPDVAHRGRHWSSTLTNGPGHVERHLLEAPALDQRPAADRDEDLVGGERERAAGGLDREAALAVEPGDLGAEMQLDPGAAEPAPHRPGQRLVIARQDAVGGLDDGHRGAELPEGDAELQADIAGADHRQPLRQLPQRQRLGRGDDIAAERQHRAAPPPRSRRRGSHARR